MTLVRVLFFAFLSSAAISSAHCRKAAVREQELLTRLVNLSSSERSAEANELSSARFSSNEKRVFRVRPRDVAALVHCHFEYFPNTGDPVAFPVSEPMVLSDEESDEWMLKCLNNRTNAKGMAALMEEGVLPLLHVVNTKLHQTRQMLFDERINLIVQIFDAQNNTAKFAPYEAIEANRKRLTTLQQIIRVQRTACVHSLLVEKVLENSTLLERVATKMLQFGLDIQRYREAAVSMFKAMVNDDFLLQDKDAKKELFAGIFDYVEFKRGLAVLHAFTEQQVIVDDDDNELAESIDVWWTTENSSKPTRGRTIYLIRHAERLDNVVPLELWQNDSRLNPLNLKPGNSPLSEHGRREQADALSARFESIRIDHLFASPLERTMETATRLLARKAGAVSIKPEPGFIERLDMCDSPPSYFNAIQLKARYALVDLDYNPVFNRSVLRRLQAEQVRGDEDNPVQKIVRVTLERILSQHSGDTFVIVSHGATIGAMHKAFTGSWAYVAQSSVSKFVELSHSGSMQFRLEYTSNTDHLDSVVEPNKRRNTRPF